MDTQQVICPVCHLRLSKGYDNCANVGSLVMYHPHPQFNQKGAEPQTIPTIRGLLNHWVYYY